MSCTAAYWAFGSPILVTSASFTEGSASIPPTPKTPEVLRSIGEGGVLRLDLFFGHPGLRRGSAL